MPRVKVEAGCSGGSRRNGQNSLPVTGMVGVVMGVEVMVMVRRVEGVVLVVVIGVVGRIRRTRGSGSVGGGGGERWMMSKGCQLSIRPLLMLLVAVQERTRPAATA